MSDLLIKLEEEREVLLKKLSEIESSISNENIRIFHEKYQFKEGDILVYRGENYLFSRVNDFGWVYGRKKTKSGWHKTETNLYTYWTKA